MLPYLYSRFRSLAPGCCHGAALMAAGSARAEGMDQAISDIVGPIVNPIVSTIFYSVPVAGTQFPLIVGWLIIAAVVFTLYFGFVQFRLFGDCGASGQGRLHRPEG